MASRFKSKRENYYSKKKTEQNSERYAQKFDLNSVANYSPEGPNSLLRRQRTSRTIFNPKSIINGFSTCDFETDKVNQMFLKLDREMFDKRSIWRNNSYKESRKKTEGSEAEPEVQMDTLRPNRRNFDDFYKFQAEKLFRGLKFGGPSKIRQRVRHKSLLHQMEPRKFIKGSGTLNLGDNMRMGIGECSMDHIKNAQKYLFY